MIGILSVIGLLLTAVTRIGAVDVDPIVIKGNHFFYENNGTEFLIVGVAYQSNIGNDTTADEKFVDPLADGTTCNRDIPYMQQLNINTIRVYAIDTSVSHDDCMNAFAEAGIYVISDLDEPGESINRADPQWTVDIFNRYKQVVDALAGYENVLGFFVGNEVPNNKTNTDSAPFVKAAVRDTKAYISAMGYRAIPVGYSTNDDSDTRVPMAEFFDCDPEDAAVDFYGYNMYEWCGNSSYEESGYKDRTEEFSGYNIPFFFSEYGCNTIQPRTFTSVQAIYSDEMTEVWSGGIVYEWFEEVNNYGLVSAIDSTSVSTMVDFNYFKSEISMVSPSLLTASDFTPTATTAQSCPTENSYWSAATKLPPMPDSLLCDCMYESLACVVSSSVSDDDYGDMFSYVCGETSCDGITANGTTPGDYGAYSMCSAEEQLSFVLDVYYNAHSQQAWACSFSGSASTKAATTSGSTCSSLLKAASSGTGSVTATADITLLGTGTVATGQLASGTAAATSGATSSSSSSSSSASASSAAMSNNIVHFWSTEYILFGVSFLVASGLGSLSVFYA